MALPMAVLKAVKDADNMYNQVYGGNVPVEPTVTPVTPVPAATVDTPVVQSITPVAPATPIADPTLPVQVQEPAPADDAAYRQMYLTLKGKYDSEVPRLSGQVKNLAKDLENAQVILSALGDSNPPSTTPAAIKLLSDKELEEYGPELIDVIRKAAREEFEPVITKLTNENSFLQEKLQTVSTTATKSIKDTLYRELYSAVPQWKTLNSDQAFLDWLAQPDLLSGASRQDLLTRAFENNETNRVIMFFKTYLEQTTNPGAAVVTQAQPAAVQLDTLVAPGRPRGSEVTVGAQINGKSIWTEPEIAAFYRDVRLGKFANSLEERARIEADIISAASEPGRIKGVNQKGISVF